MTYRRTDNQEPKKKGPISTWEKICARFEMLLDNKSMLVTICSFAALTAITIFFVGVNCPAYVAVWWLRAVGFSALIATVFFVIFISTEKSSRTERAFLFFAAAIAVECLIAEPFVLEYSKANESCYCEGNIPLWRKKECRVLDKDSQ